LVIILRFYIEVKIPESDDFEILVSYLISACVILPPRSNKLSIQTAPDRSGYALPQPARQKSQYSPHALVPPRLQIKGCTPEKVWMLKTRRIVIDLLEEKEV